MSISEPPDPLSAASGPPLTNAMAANQSSSIIESNRNASLSTLSRLESLPVEMVNRIGNHLELADLKNFRMTNKKMCNHLSFNLKEYFKVISCWPVQAVFDSLSKFQKQPLAGAVESLIWVRYRSELVGEPSDTKQEMLHQKDGKGKHRNLQGSRAGYAPLSPEMSDTDQQRLMAQSVSMFPNLKILGISFRKHPSTRCLLPELEDPDVDFFVGVITRVNRPVEAVGYVLDGCCGIDWTGSLQTSNSMFTSGSVDEEDYLETLPMPDFSLLDFYRGRGAVRHPLFEQGLKSFKFSHVSLESTLLQWVFDHLPKLEEVRIQNCTIIGPHLEGGPMVTEEGQFRKSIRRFNASGCIFLMPNRPQISNFFQSLQNHGHLEGLRFEAAKGFTFNWVGNGPENDRTRLPSVIERQHVQDALNDMDEWVRAQAPGPNYDLRTWTTHRLVYHTLFENDTP